MSQKEKLTAYTILLLFSAYWGVTLLYNSPNNYVKIQANDTVNFFGTYFQQRWNFFAPPPRSNDRLYYIFIEKDNADNKVMVEALKPIHDKKRSHLPFNMEPALISDIIAGSVGIIQNNVAKNSKTSQMQNPDLPEASLQHVRNAQQMIRDAEANLVEITTLKNYAGLIAKKQNLSADKYYYRIFITQEMIPKFQDRYSEEPRKEYQLFESYVYDFSHQVVAKTLISEEVAKEKEAAATEEEKSPEDLQRLKEMEVRNPSDKGE